MFEIPINPAFFNSTNIRQPKKLQSLQSYLKDQGIAATQTMHSMDQLDRCFIQQNFWRQGIDSVIPGYLDLQLTDKLVEFVDAINFSALNESELELLFSESLSRDPVSR